MTKALPADARFRIGQKVWFVTTRDVAAKEVVYVSKRCIRDIHGAAYELGTPRTVSARTYSVYGAIWRWLFATRAAARYQAELLKLIIRHVEDYSDADDTLRWFYALEAATRAKRKARKT